SDESV
ncbi:hypothetical protein D039_5320B, partial [Vibrio parahaemolyticus EKP-028]